MSGTGQIADFSSVQMSFREEVTPGTFDPGALTVLNTATESMKGSRGTVRSAVSNATKTPGPRKWVKTENGGNFATELLIGPTMKRLLALGLCNTFTADYAISSTAIQAIASTNTLKGAPLTAVPKNSIIRFKGFAFQSGSAWDAFVTGKAASDEVQLAWVVIPSDVAAGPTIKVAGSSLTDGITAKSSTWERYQADQPTLPYQAYLRQYIESLEVDLQAEQIIKVTLTFMGNGPNARTLTSIASPAAPTAADIGEYLDMSNNLSMYRTSGALDGNLKAFKVTVKNNFSRIPSGATRDGIGFSQGQRAVTGDISGWLLDGNQRVLDAYSFASVPVHCMVSDATGQSMVFSIWSLSYNDMGDVNKSAATGAMPLDTPWEADPDATTKQYMMVTALPAPTW
jgi:hypothetical protein